MTRAAVAILLLALAGAGCGAEILRVPGVVVSVDQVSVADVRSFTLRTTSGEMLTFRVDRLDLSRGGFPANHLREHMATVTAVIVDYTDENGERIAVRVTDAP